MYMKFIFVLRLSMSLKSDHRSKCSNLSNWKEVGASTEFEPMTGYLRDTGMRCSTNCAVKPHIGSKVILLSSYLPVQ